MLLENKIALITGGISGIGEATTKLFVEHGAKVIVFDKNVNDEVGNNQNITYIKIDITQIEDVKKEISDIISNFGRIDTLFSNAGINPNIGKIEETEDHHWEEILNTNLTSSFQIIREVIPYMKKQKCGTIIGTSSISGRVWAANHSVPYGVSKTGIEAIIKSIASQYGPDGIRSNCILPGFIETPLNWVKDESVKKNIFSRIPLRRAGTPTDVAKVALFLASELSSYVNGESIIVDGGFTI
jgi:3-oxoacyl-[acyl-carrier protein] reductase